MKLRVTEQGSSIYVLGTHQIVDAARVLPRGVVGWSVSECGMYARRKHGLRFYHSESPRMPKDARPGVRFGGVLRDPEPDDIEAER